MIGNMSMQTKTFPGAKERVLQMPSMMRVQQNKYASMV